MLLISGFAIFLLIGIYEPLDKMGTELMRGGLSERMQVMGLPLGSLTAVWFILLVNLCIHVLFRGLWISTIGLRSATSLALDSFGSQWVAEGCRSFPKGMPIGRTPNN